jgi:hypothetical protein
MYASPCATQRRGQIKQHQNLQYIETEGRSKPTRVTAATHELLTSGSRLHTIRRVAFIAPTRTIQWRFVRSACGHACYALWLVDVASGTLIDKQVGHEAMSRHSFSRRSFHSSFGGSSSGITAILCALFRRFVPLPDMTSPLCHSGTLSGPPLRRSTAAAQHSSDTRRSRQVPAPRVGRSRPIPSEGRPSEGR